MGATPAQQIKFALFPSPPFVTPKAGKLLRDRIADKDQPKAK